MNIITSEIEKGIANHTQLTSIGSGASKFAWFDLRLAGSLTDPDHILSLLSHLKFDGVIAEEAQLERIPAGLRKVLYVPGTPTAGDIERFNRIAGAVLILEPEAIESGWFKQHRNSIGVTVGTSVSVTDPASLQRAVALTHDVQLLIVEFRDDTKIPLEIVLADAQNTGCAVVMKVKDNIESKVVFGVLECGADGVIFTTDDWNELYALHDVVHANRTRQEQRVETLTVVRTSHIGMGDRACIDLTTYLGLDEGILLGSFSNGGLLACSETHPLPYMPTRPFRVNAGSLHSYVLAPDNQTWYLSDLRAGMEILVVGTNGKARRAAVGRVKIERRPLLYIEAESSDGTRVNTIMQEDWHVRIFGEEGQPLNITNLRPGAKVLGHTMASGRHVGVKVDEFILEQ
jgi:3-amino-4-hydroxybenzoic acid synthase